MELDITFDRTGGFAGLCLRATVAADQLDTEPAGIAAELFTAGPTFAVPAEVTNHRPRRFPPPGPFADAFTYRLELRSASRSEIFEWPDPDVPEEVRPLLSALTRRAEPVEPLADPELR